MKPQILIVSLALVIPAVSPAAARLSLEECKRLYAQIDQVNDARRKGGSNDYMKNLKKKREKLRRAMHDGQCKKYGSQLRNH